MSVHVKSMLARLQSTLGEGEPLQEILLLPGKLSSNPLKSINLVVGYNGSRRSQAALDLTLWMAHQTRLVTTVSVVVQVVYVVEDTQVYHGQAIASVQNGYQLAAPEYPEYDDWSRQAESVLQQAQRLVLEWQGSFVAHVRIGSVARELRRVVEEKSAASLCLGCYNALHPIIQNLGRDFLCPVLGIPKGAD